MIGFPFRCDGSGFKRAGELEVMSVLLACAAGPSAVVMVLWLALLGDLPI